MSKLPASYRIHRISFLKSLLLRWYLRKYSRIPWYEYPEHLRKVGK